MGYVLKKNFNIPKLLILGLIIALNKCESRVLNVNNAWTLPQGGLNVFYRFFRDKISWFEADAVCQFHHANLVTVESSIQFDATRNFLKTVNVTQPVWIGLMRPQNSQIFVWSNSKPLASIAGYWAESLPLIESPLCAVIDPIRDFRWHALRCGGPETASFLCEMNVPNWTKECIPTNTGSTLIRYMADSGTVEITKNCENEEIIQKVCRSKRDIDKIKEELICKNDHRIKTNQNLTNTYFESLEFIKKISSDNNEDNNINVQPEKEKKTTENTIKKLIEQFDIEDIMQADEPHNGLKDDTRTEDTQKPLPHIKKSLPQHLKHYELVKPTTIPKTSTKNTTEQNQILSSTETFGSTNYLATRTIPIFEDNTTIIKHPMNFKQTHASVVSTVATEDELLKHSLVTKETSDSHFIPPMLLVKSHYTSTKSHFDEQNTKADITSQNLQLNSKEIAASTPYSLVSSDTSIRTESNENEFISSTNTEKTNGYQVFNPKTENFNNKTISFIVTRKNSNNITNYLNTKSTHTHDFSSVTLSDFNISKEVTMPPKIPNKFSDGENFQSLKLDRKRILTKPETTTYLKKIFAIEG